MRQGMGFIFTHAAISFVILSMTAGMFAVRCFGALLSVYVRDVLLSSAALFGTLNTLIGVGMITGTQCLHRFAKKIPPQHLVIYGLGGMGMAVLITAVFGLIATTALGMLALGFFAAFIMIPAQTLLQRETPSSCPRPASQRHVRDDQVTHLQRSGRHAVQCVGGSRR